MITEEQIFNTLYTKYSKLFLNKEEVSHELGISQTTLNRRIKAHEALPEFEKDGGKYLFSLLSLSKYLTGLHALNNGL